MVQFAVEHERGLTIRCVYVLSLDFGERLRSTSAGFSSDKKSVSVILTSIFSIKSSISLQSMGLADSSYCRCAMVIIHRDDGNCMIVQNLGDNELFKSSLSNHCGCWSFPRPGRPGSVWSPLKRFLIPGQGSG